MFDAPLAPLVAQLAPRLAGVRAFVVLTDRGHMPQARTCCAPHVCNKCAGLAHKAADCCCCQNFKHVLLHCQCESARSPFSVCVSACGIP